MGTPLIQAVIDDALKTKLFSPAQRATLSKLYSSLVSESATSPTSASAAKTYAVLDVGDDGFLQLLGEGEGDDGMRSDVHVAPEVAKRILRHLTSGEDVSVEVAFNGNVLRWSAKRPVSSPPAEGAPKEGMLRTV